MFYPANIEAKIDFTVIREELLRRCASPLGRERVDAMQMETSYETVSRLLLLTDQMRMAQSDPMLSFPRGEIADMREAVSRIRIEGLFLDETELDSLRKTLSYAVELEAFFASLKNVVNFICGGKFVDADVYSVCISQIFNELSIGFICNNHCI